MKTRQAKATTWLLTGTAVLAVVLSSAPPATADADPESKATYQAEMQAFVASHQQPTVTADVGTREYAAQQKQVYNYWKEYPWEAAYGQYGDKVSQVTVELAVGSDGVARAAVSYVVTPAKTGSQSRADKTAFAAAATEKCYGPSGSVELKHCFQIPTSWTLSVALHNTSYGTYGFSYIGKHRLSYTPVTSPCPVVDAGILYTTGTKTIPKATYILTSVATGFDARWASTWMTTGGAVVDRQCY